MIYYHASQTRGIAELLPRISNHGESVVYLSEKRENVLVYLSNAVEKYCSETGFEHEGVWTKWASYGFYPDGTLHIDEYYPGALEDTYKGVSGYVYSAENVVCAEKMRDIPYSVYVKGKVAVSDCEFIEDAYETILRAEALGKIRIERYVELSDRKKDWIARTVKSEYENAEDKPEYRHFLIGKFNDMIL